MTESKGSRDEFTAATKRLLAERAGFLCSNPACRRLTIGPQVGGSGKVNIGEAAHITAAASGPGAARYDARLTSDERKSYDNGIWLCRVHAHQVDHDEKNYSVETLKKWRKEAEEFAARQIAAGTTPVGGLIDADLVSEVREMLIAFGFTKEEDFEMRTAEQ